MSILSGFKKVIRYIKTSAGYSKLSQWTSSQTVEMDDGSNLENKITDINTYINNKANISSPTFTGIPKAPTASNGTNNTQIATTAFANNAVSNHNSSSVAHSDIRSLITGLENAIPEASTTPSKAPGTASAGVSQEYSRGDHVHPAQTSVSGNAGTATKLSNARNINGVLFDGSSSRVNYGVCSTSSATVAKTVSCSGFSLITGAEITVKFTITNTASNPTLNVNGTGAKPIYYRGSAITPSYLSSNRTYTFRYNGAQYDFVGDIDTNTRYGVVSTSSDGLCPKRTGTTTKFLRDDGVWAELPSFTPSPSDFVVYPVYFNNTGSERIYYGFAYMLADVGSGWGQFTAIVTGCGNYAYNRMGTYLVSCSTRDGVSMRVTELEAGIGGYEFGYWPVSDENGSAIVFGMHTAPYNYPFYVIELTIGYRQTIVHREGAAPSGWTPVDIVRFVNGVKGDKETAYRDGLVNLTAENIGAFKVYANDMNITEGVWNDFKGEVKVNKIIDESDPFISIVRPRGGLNIPFLPDYSPAIAFGLGDVHAILCASFGDSQKAYIAAGSSNKINWYKQLAFTDSNVASSTKLQTARKINGSLFDGTEDINIQEYYNFSFPSNYGEERYRGFCSLYNTATVQANPSELTLLVSGVGSYGTGDKKSGVYLIQCRTMQGLVMDVIELSPPGSAGGIEFGYWSDGDKIIFGVHHGTWNYKINVLKIQQTYGHIWEINVANLYDSTAKPNGWNTVSKKGMVMSESGVSAIKQITQEQYNALSSAEKMNNTIYFITDAD